MKKLTLLLLLSTSILVGYSQSKTPQPKPDTVLISITDINQTLDFLSEKITKKQWDEAQQYFQLLYNQALQRKSKLKK